MWSVISSNPQCHRSPDCTWNPVFTYYIQLRDLGSYPLPDFFFNKEDIYDPTYPKKKMGQGSLSETFLIASCSTRGNFTFLDVALAFGGKKQKQVGTVKKLINLWCI